MADLIRGRRECVLLTLVASAIRNGLSVNSLEVHTENQIAAIYAKKFQVPRPVAMSIPTIEEYNEAARAAKIAIAIDPTSKRWVHFGPSGSEDSYRHDSKHANESHCLVRYTRLLEEFEMLKFAHRMARKPTFGLY